MLAETDSTPVLESWLIPNSDVATEFIIVKRKGKLTMKTWNYYHILKSPKANVKYYLAIQATSAPSECIFSVASRLIAARCNNRLNPNLAQISLLCI
jgi:hypothetical protein